MTNALKESVKRGFDSSVSGLTFEEKRLVELCFLYNNKVEDLVSKFADKSVKAKVEGYSISEKKFNGWIDEGMFYDRTAGHITYWVFLLTKFLTHKQTREQVSGDRWKKLLEAEDILRKAALQGL